MEHQDTFTGKQVLGTFFWPVMQHNALADQEIDVLLIRAGKRCRTAGFDGCVFC